ncbi:MAG: TonB-dependent receptor [Deltaproteobacteria bacterium]|nr:TonB-dependent receptor [Deltaproteobacteria bacterium]
MSPLTLTLLAAAWAEDPPEAPAPSAEAALVVEAPRPARSASDRSFDRAALDTLTGRSTDELLRGMPGLHMSAHGGQGKAYQFYLRGFDTVHGAGLAVRVEGAPLNEISNVHGQGYLDLHLIPMSLVRTLTVSPGLARPEEGDLAVAGSATMDLGLEREGLTVTVGGGTDRTGLVTLGHRPLGAAPGSFLLAEVQGGEGVGESRAHRHLRGAAGVEREVHGRTLRGMILAHDGVFESPGVLTEADLAAGEVGFYDAYPGSGGGRSRRALGVLRLSRVEADRRRQWTAYAAARGLSLHQNFTGALYDPALGDGASQTHHALTGGLRVEGQRRAALPIDAGAELRLDGLRQAEDHADLAGEPLDRRFEAEAGVVNLGAWLAAPLHPRPWLLIAPGLRADALGYAVRAAVEGGVRVDDPQTALAWAPVLSPKLTLTASPTDTLRLFTTAGRGFRSPEARGLTEGDGDGGSERAPVTQVQSVELGASFDPLPWLGLRAASYATFVSNELMFDHTAGRFLSGGPTRRLGLDAALLLRPTPHLGLDLELSLCDGKLRGAETPLPYAPRALVAARLWSMHLPIGATAQLSAGARLWWMGPRPLPGGFASQPTGAIDLTLRVDRGDLSLDLDLDNVLGQEWRDGEFMYASRWDLNAAPSELPARHITAGAPRAARLSLTWRR